MKWTLLISLFLGASAAQAAGVNDVLPNGQNNLQVQTTQAPQTTGTTATPNASGQIYQRRFYRQMYRTPRPRVYRPR